MADLVLGKTPDEGGGPVTIATGDLVTHGVIVGMTGSGKTGLGVVLIEQCLAVGVPALVIDPKGDLTNLALVFPGLSGPEFEPWVEPAAARAAGVGVGEFATAQADLWRSGLAAWGVDGAALATYRDSFEITIYTPGSTAGVPLNVLGSLRAPGGIDPEALADEVEGYVTSLLSLIGIEADPLSSREHILLSNLIHGAWSAGEDLDLPGLLARVQQPPIRKLGVFELDQFFPAKDRVAFAMRLNAVLAAPTFQAWMTGDPIDIQSMLWSDDGKPRCAIVTTAHLSDEDRQSATSLILAKLVTWMRRQSGTTDLRALVYMDEVAGYLPPTASPPTKKPIMLLMKQARAFGLGVVLSTQNPVDVDYKALGNAGTWMIGRLTTERDLSRLLAGLSSADGGTDADALGGRIAALGKRQFLMRRAGTPDVATFGTRWARSYLRGPMTRDQIARVSAGAAGEHTGSSAQRPTPGVPRSVPVGSGQPVPPIPPQPTASLSPPVAPLAPPVAPPAPLAADESPVAPPVAAGVPVGFLDPAAPWATLVHAQPPSGSGPRLEAAVAARVMLRFDEAKADLIHDEEYEAILAPAPVSTGSLEPIAVDYDDRDFVESSPSGARFALPVAPIASKTYWTGLRRDLTDHLVRSRTIEIFANPELKLYSRAGESGDEFRARCVAAASDQADRATAALQGKYESKTRALSGKLSTATAQAQAAESARTSDMLSSVGSVLGGFLGGRRSSSAIGTALNRQRAAAARADAASARVEEVQQQLRDLEADLTDEVYRIRQEWLARADAISTFSVPLEKMDVRVLDMRLVWIPVAG